MERGEGDNCPHPPHHCPEDPSELLIFIPYYRQPSKASWMQMQNLMPRTLATRQARRSRASSLPSLGDCSESSAGLYCGRRRRLELSNERWLRPRPSIRCRRGPRLLLLWRLALGHPRACPVWAPPPALRRHRVRRGGPAKIGLASGVGMNGRGGLTRREREPGTWRMGNWGSAVR
jgi:hypothetical protein